MRTTHQKQTTIATHARRAACAAACLLVALPALAQITLYENEAFNGRTYRADRDVPNLTDRGFNDRASSVVVQHERWQICDNAGYAGQCVVLTPGRYASLGAMGLNDRVSSARIVAGAWQPDNNNRAANDYKRRPGEKLFQANVVSVRAVVAAPEQRCWMEREEVGNDHKANVPGAVAGALIGGILGHQVGGGTGRDIATVGGAVAGGAVGSRIGGRDEPRTREVQRCENVARGEHRPEYWDVTYDFGGREHHVQLANPPGRTISVNASGEPRI